MSHDEPPPRPALAPPFSRPTHPGPLPAIPPRANDSGRTHRPTPYASAPIPAPIPAPAAEAWPAEAGRSASHGESVRGGSGQADAAVDSAGAHGAAEAGQTTGAAGSDGSPWSPAAGQPDAAPAGDARAAWPAGEGARSLRDVPGDHGHPGGVPANPEAEVESVDAVSDYPVDPVWSSDAVVGWGGDVADWETVNASVARPPAAGADAPLSFAAAEVEMKREPSDLARGAAATLERVARQILRGELVLPSVSWPQTAPAMLAAVLTALLAQPAGEDRAGEAREAPASEPDR